MNRRQFTQSLGAVAALPAMPMRAIAGTGAAQALPETARFWAVYMRELHGTCTPQTLAKMLKVSLPQASAISTELVAQNVLTPAQVSGHKLAKASVKQSLQLQSQPSTTQPRQNRFNDWLEKRLTPDDDQPEQDMVNDVDTQDELDSDQK